MRVVGRTSVVANMIRDRSHHSTDQLARLSYAHRLNAIAQERERRLAEIRSLAGPGPMPASFAYKAQRLLTLGWARASWRSRAEILRTVDWLLDLERVRQSGQQASTVGVWSPANGGK